MSFPHGFVERAGGKQLFLRACRFDIAVVYDENPVCIRNGGKAMRDDEQRLSAHQVRKCGLDDRLIFGIRIRSRFVENDDRRIL